MSDTPTEPKLPTGWPAFLRPPNAHDWPEDITRERGCYQHTCRECEATFFGDKRRPNICKQCCQPPPPPEAAGETATDERKYWLCEYMGNWCLKKGGRVIAFFSRESDANEVHGKLLNAAALTSKLAELTKERETMRTALQGIADMPHYDQDDCHRLRHKAALALDAPSAGEAGKAT